MIIYKVTNLINGKVYIGQTIKTLEYRKKQHISMSNSTCRMYISRAIRKYGVDNFDWKIICICPNIDSLNEQEQYYIALYGSFGNGYNLMSGGNNGLHSQETKDKIRQFQLGHSVSEKTRQKISNNNAKHWSINKYPEKAKLKISKSNKGRKGVKLFGERNGMYGKHYSEEHKKYLSEINLGKVLSKETRKKMSENNVGMKGKHHSQETKDKIRTALLNRNIAKHISQ